MNFSDWLFFSIIISRRLTNAYYIIMLIISIIAIFLAYKMKFKRFSLNLWLIAGLICLLWESYLFTTGTRSYNFASVPELLYHALTEAGPGLIIMILFAHKIELIDISEFSDVEAEPKRVRTGEKGTIKRSPLKKKIAPRAGKEKIDPTDEEMEE